MTSDATMTVTVSADARVVDEADVAAFLEAFREQIEARRREMGCEGREDGRDD